MDNEDPGRLPTGVSRHTPVHRDLLSAGKDDSMLVLLPPSESKTPAQRGRVLDLSARPEPLRAPTADVLDALVDVCAHDPLRARSLLKLGPSQDHLVATNAHLMTSPTAPAWRVYSGVLYDALDFASLGGTARRRGLSQVMVASAAFGLVPLGERIPAYRFSAGSQPLPGLPPLRQLWSEPLTQFVTSLNANLIIDLRSGAYAAMWPLPAQLRERSVTVKIWQRQPGGERVAVSHHNKAFKGRLVRALLQQKRLPASPRALLNALVASGWDAGLEGARLDVVVDPHLADTPVT